MKSHKKWSIAWAFVFVLIPALAHTWQGKVVSVADGDTVGVMHNGKEERIRLYGVDCPEKRQDFGQVAKQFTANLVFEKVVDVKPINTDRYGRTVGVVNVNGKILNEELVRGGFAWVYSQYCKESFCSDWAGLQETAKENGIGLWSTPNPIPPWEFRRGESKNGNKQEQSSVIYHGNVSTKVFHRPGCSQYDCKNCTEVLKSREEAIAKGFKPCGICKP